VRAATEAPNIVVFLTDQQRWDTLGLHGNPLDLTPNLDRLARAGTHAYHCFTPQPLCGPARSCLQTGMYATASGCYRNGIALPPGCRTLAHAFREAGYHTAYIGKWHLADTEPTPESQRGGYDHWLASNVLEFSSAAYRTVVYDHANRPVELPGYRVDALTDAAIRHIHARAHGRRPFYLFLSLLEPHHQNQTDSYSAPDGYAERYAGRWTPPDLAALGGSAQRHLPGYYGMVRRLDEAFGRLLDALKSLGLRENTILLFTSDHGCHFKTRNAEYKRSPHEASIRTPAVLAGPGFDGGGQVRELVSLVDLPPTLLDAAGLTVPAAMQGRSLLPLTRGERQGWPEDVLVQVSESEVGRALRTSRWKYYVVAPDEDGRRRPSAELYVERYLYDLESDPYELDNLAGRASHAGISRVLRERLLDKLQEAGEPPATVTPAPVVGAGPGSGLYDRYGIRVDTRARSGRPGRGNRDPGHGFLAPLGMTGGGPSARPGMTPLPRRLRRRVSLSPASVFWFAGPSVGAPPRGRPAISTCRERSPRGGGAPQSAPGNSSCPNVGATR
jgi:arylsulfatase A-like enzyme